MDDDSAPILVVHAESADLKKRAAHSATLKEMKNTNTYTARSEMTGTKKYIIHDNFSIPWVVYCDKKEIKIIPVQPFCREGSLGDKETEIITVADFEGYWSGYDSSFKQEHGNSILVKLSSESDTGKYLFIGSNIIEFDLSSSRETKDEVIDFVTPIGNNDVPYPVIYTKKYVIFANEFGAVLASSMITQATIADSENIYSEFYGHLHPENLEKQIKKSFRHSYIRELCPT